MRTLAIIGEGLDRAWASLAEGWQQLRTRAAEAITRFHPRREKDVQRLDEEPLLQGPQWGVLAAEVEERGDEVRVRLEAPGLEPGDFDISVVRNQLVVRGEKRLQHVHRDGRFHVMECAYGSFERVIPLPRRVDSSGVSARYRRGVLTVRLPIAESARIRRIEVAG